MVELFGRNWSRTELLRHVGSLAQIADVTILEVSDAAARGVRIARVRAGELSYDVLIDRGADIGQVDVAGRPVAFWSNVGLVAPWYREPSGSGFLRSFGGGLVTTCGLDHAFNAEEEPAPDVSGSPDPVRRYPQHGRVSSTPARLCGYGATWSGDECELYVETEVRQAAMHGETLVLRRRTSTRLGTRRIRIADTVTNEGHRSADHMFVYHCNLGYPSIGPGARLEDGDVLRHVGGSRLPTEIPGPASAARSVVEERRVLDGVSSAEVRLVSQAGTTSMRWSSDTLPYLVLWQMFGEGRYVLGIEPSTNRTAGRADARRRGELQAVGAGESVRYQLEFGFETQGSLTAEDPHDSRTMSRAVAST